MGALCAIALREMAAAVGPIALDYYRLARSSLDLYRAYRDPRRFFLYLRSFKDSTFATTTNTYIAPENDGRTTWKISENLSQLLDTALSQFGRVLFISHESTDIFSDYGLIIDSTDETWRSIFFDCAKNARAILIAPGDTPGLLEEMHTISYGSLMEKTVWIMRPTDGSGERGRSWAAISDRMKENGLKLPEYDERGALFVGTGDGWMVVAFRRWPTETEAISDAFSQLVQTLEPSRFAGGLPLREVLTQIPLRNHIPSDTPWIVPSSLRS